MCRDDIKPLIKRPAYVLTFIRKQANGSFSETGQTDIAILTAIRFILVKRIKQRQFSGL